MAETIGDAVIKIIPDFDDFSKEMASSIKKAEEQVSKAEFTPEVDKRKAETEGKKAGEAFSRGAESGVDGDAINRRSFKNVLGAAGDAGKRAGKRFSESLKKNISTEGLSKAFDNVGRQATKIGRRATIGLTVPIAGAFTLGIKEAQNMEAALREVNSLTGTVGKEAEQNFRFFSRGVAELSSEVGIAQEELVGGLYNALSAGVPTENAFEFLQQQAMLTRAGVTDMATAVDATTTIMNAFGRDTAEAGAINDKLFATVKFGKTTMDELTGSLQNVAGAAAGGGVSINQTLAAIAQLTAVGFDSARAATALNAAIRGASADTPAMQKALEAVNRVAGTNVKSFKELQEETGSFQQALDAVVGSAIDVDVVLARTGSKSMEDLIDKTGSAEAAFAELERVAANDVKALQDLFGSADAVQAILGLTGGNAESAMEKLEGLRDSTGSVQNGFEEISKSAQFQEAMVEFNNAMIELGREVLPIAAEAARGFAHFLKQFREGNPEGSKFVTIALAIAAALGPVIAAFGFLATGIAKALPLFAKIGRLFTGIAGVARALAQAVLVVGAVFGVGAAVVAAAVAGIVVAVGLLIFKWEEFKIGVDIIWEAVKDAFQAGWDFIVEVFNGIKSVIATAVKNIGGALNRWKERFTETVSTIGRLISRAVSLYVSMPQRIMAALASLGQMLFSRMVAVMRRMKAGILEGAENVFEFFRNLPGRIVNLIGDAGKILFGVGEAIIQGLWDGMKSVWGKVEDWLGGLAGKIKDLKGPIEYDRTILKPAGNAIMEGLWDGLRSGFDPVQSWLRGVAPSLTGFFKADDLDNVWSTALSDLTPAQKTVKLDAIMPKVPFPAMDAASVLSQGKILNSMFGTAISSHFRTPAANKAAGGVSNSQHLTGMALDFVGLQHQMDNLAAYLRKFVGTALTQVLWQTKGHFDHVHAGWMRSLKGRRQFGGRVTGGEPFLVGEAGPEVFVPNQPGMVFSNKDAQLIATFARQQMNQRAPGGEPGRGLTIENMHVNSNSSDPKTVAMRVAAQLEGMRAGVRTR